MKMKHLSLAITAVLATTGLTACGGGDDSAPNLTPISTPTTGTTTTPTTGTTTTPTTGTTTTPTTGTDTTTTAPTTGTDTTTTAPTTGTDTTTTTDTTTPATPISTDSQVATVYTGDATSKASVVGQQYVRGATAEFDRVNNGDKQANATVNSFQTVDNKKLTNIVVGRETVNPLDTTKAVRRYVGQDGKTPDVNDEFAIQTWNGAGSFSGARTAVDEKDPTQTTIAHSNVALNGQFRDYTKQRDAEADNGLVSIVKAAGDKTYTVKGQDHQSLKFDTDGVTVATNGVLVQGSDSPTRVFGRDFNQTDTDGLNVVGKTLDGTLSTTAKQTANSWAYNPAQKGVETTTATVGAAGTDQVGKLSEHVDGAGKFNLAATSIKLGHVQYGRVTSNIDVISGIDPNDVTVQRFIYSPYVDKNRFVAGDDVSTKEDKAVDTYFYRGVGETTLAQMAALPQDKTYTYRGHALMYGIDNSFHGAAKVAAVDTTGTNSFTNPTDAPADPNMIGLGNFVQANFNTGTKEISGSIYNVWLKDDAKREQFIDNLVTFEGKVEGNTVINGKADLAYTAAAENGAFTGSFYGRNAQELGGAVNSVAEKYGDKAWGGVFGAQLVSSSDNANQID